MRITKTTLSGGMILFSFIMLLLFPRTGSCHGTGFQLFPEQHPVCARFYYSGGTPMAFAEILVFAPGEELVEFQNGRTDRQGVFAFCPRQSGKWRMEVNDGRGHKVSAMVDVQDVLKKATANEPIVAVALHGHGTASPGWKEVVLGLSLMMNLWGGLRWVKKRFSS